MRSLLTYRNTPQGRIRVSQDALDIADRIQKGDGIMWEGDPRMHVNFNRISGRYEIWRLGEDGVDRVLASFAPDEWDHRVFRWLVEHDTRRIDVIDRVRKNNDLVRKRGDDTTHEIEKEAKRFLEWANYRLGYDDNLPSHKAFPVGG